MDMRKPLAAGTVLEFPGMRCTVEETIGCGSNAMVYRAWYPDLHNSAQRHTVLVKELFPFDASGGITRNERGHILCAENETGLWSLHLDSFEKGNAVHLAMLEKFPEQIGANLNTFALNRTLYTVLGFTGGRTLARECGGPASDLRQLTHRMIGLLDALEAFHQSNLLHLDIAPDNVLLIGDGERERVMLIDYNSVYDLSSGPVEGQIYSTAKVGYSPPEVRAGQTQAFSFASDLYSVAAVFFKCLTGATLTPFQMIRQAPPDVSACPCLRKASETVRCMAAEILSLGLQSLPRRRYASVAAMGHAFKELLDRIDGVGITHWALWEAGKRNVEKAIRENPAYRFLNREDELFPLRAHTASGKTLPMGDVLEEMMTPEGGHVLLLAGGGMGKTTAMLHAVAGQHFGYSPERPAITYVSLYGFKEGRTDFIQGKLLETLHYKPETTSYADAAQALKQLMDGPTQNGGEERPVLLILLDGLNEAAGATQTLYEEILSLSRLKRVRLMVSSRSEEEALPFERVRLSELTKEDVRQTLSGKGLLMPENPAVTELLRTPLMLSIYLQAAKAENKQLSVQSKDELLGAYFTAMRKKEIEPLPQDADERWQVEVAVDYVLPSVAAALHRSGRALSDAEMLRVVNKCYRLFASRGLRRAFPQWIGRSRAIRGQAANGEEWYGQIVHGLLWKRMGLLVRDGDGGYQIAHQVLEEYLLKAARENRLKIVTRQRIRIAGAISAVLIGGLIAVNFTVGFPLARGMLFSLQENGLHLLRAETNVAAIPDGFLGVPVAEVGEGAFAGNQATHLTVPGTVRQIDDSAFADCAALESVTLEEGVQRIGGNAFAGCASLHTVSLPSTLQEIQPTAFDGAYEKLVLWGSRSSVSPELAKWANRPFADRAEYEVQPWEEGVMLMNYTGPENSFVLPAYVDGLPVVKLSPAMNLLRRNTRE